MAAQLRSRMCCSCWPRGSSPTETEYASIKKQETKQSNKIVLRRCEAEPESPRCRVCNKRGAVGRRRLDPVVTRLEQRLADWTHLPIAMQEDMQVAPPAVPAGRGRPPAVGLP